MAVNEYGIDTNDIIFGGGAGYLPYFNDLLKDTTALQLGQGSLGQGLLNTLVQLRQNPASGPLGLAAFGTFGGTQGRAAGTAGQGLRDPYQGAFDRALSGLMSGIFGNPGSIYNPDNRGQVNTEATIFANANEAPTMKPANAMSAPNSMINTVLGTERPKKLATGGVVKLGDVRNMLRDFLEKAVDDADFAERVAKTNKVTSALQKLNEHRASTEGSEQPVTLAQGGNMVFAGEPHFITDARGNAKAVITEDGQPEMVKGIPGGVEVVPMNPLRRALYERSKRFSRVLAALDEGENAIPGAQTGAKFMFPNIPGSKVNTSHEGSNLLPSAGGPATPREQQVGPQFRSTYDPNTGRFTLPSEATNATTADDIQGYAKLLGGALANTSQAFNPQSLRELASGQVMRSLPSATALSTVPPTVRAGLMAFLSQALGMSPEDVQFEIDQFRPTALS
jgi:hypothetical protein